MEEHAALLLTASGGRSMPIIPTVIIGILAFNFSRNFRTEKFPLTKSIHRDETLGFIPVPKTIQTV